MGKSKKPSANMKKVAAFKSQLGDSSLSDMDDIFAREERRSERQEAEREQALYKKSCTSKNRYVSKAEAEETIRLCAEHGKQGLRCYKCSYCGGWHLTSKPQ